MAMYDVEKIKLGGFFSKSVNVLYEIKYEGPSPEGEMNSITMTLEDGTQIGKIQFSIDNTRSKITTFVIYDWSTSAYIKALLKKYLKVVKKKGVKHVEGNIYAKDNTTYDQLSLLKSLGFKVEAGSNLTGYQEYYIKKKI